jgi:hypothetical protein
MADDPRNTGEAIAQGLPGVGILMMLRRLGEQGGSEGLQRAMQMLGVGQPQQAAPPITQPLPRHGGMDANGQPIIIPPQGRSY